MYERRKEKKEASQLVFTAFYHHAKSVDMLMSESIHHRPTISGLNNIQ